MVSDVTLRKRLAAAVCAGMNAALATDMRWGVDDCTLWAVEPVRAVLGYDPASKGRGRYRTKIGAFRVLGHGGVPGALRREARRFKWHRIEARRARPGDLGIVTVDGVNTMAVCRSRGWFVARSERGFVGVRADLVGLCFAVI